MWHVVLNEEVLPQPYGTRDEADGQGGKLAEAYEAERGAPADWFVVDLPAEH